MPSGNHRLTSNKSHRTGFRPGLLSTTTENHLSPTPVSQISTSLTFHLVLWIHARETGPIPHDYPSGSHLRPRWRRLGFPGSGSSSGERGSRSPWGRTGCDRETSWSLSGPEETLSKVRMPSKPVSPSVGTGEILALGSFPVVKKLSSPPLYSNHGQGASVSLYWEACKHWLVPRVTVFGGL